MATISTNGQNQDQGTNLNSGVSNQQQQNTQPTGVGGAVTTTGQAASGQGGGGGGAAGSAAPKAASSGQYTNFNAYTQNNQKAVGNLNNVLNNNFNQQGQAAQNAVSNANSGVAQGVQQNENDLKSSLDSVNNALTTGDFSKFFNYSQAGTSGVNTTGTQGAASSATPGTSNPAANTSSPNQYSQFNGNNPVSLQLNNNFQALASGSTNGSNIQNQYNQGINAANTAQNNLQTNAQLAQTTSGIGSLLQNILGTNRGYTRGDNSLDQSLVTANGQQYGNLLNNANTNISNVQNALQGSQNLTAQQLANLQTYATNAQTQAQSLSNQGLSALNSSLSAAAAQAEADRQAAQASILNQFNTEAFNQDTANQLGIGNGALLINTLKNNGQNYNTTTSNFQNTPYLSLNQEQVQNADVINQQQLGQYSALQQLLGNNNSSNFAYNGIGNIANGTATNYNINADKFKQDLLTNLSNLQKNSNLVTNYYGDQGKPVAFSTNLFNLIDPKNIDQEINQLSNNQTVTGPGNIGVSNLNNLLNSNLASINSIASPQNGHFSAAPINSGLGSFMSGNFGGEFLPGYNSFYNNVLNSGIYDAATVTPTAQSSPVLSQGPQVVSPNVNQFLNQLNS